jgi:hypothetical protein
LGRPVDGDVAEVEAEDLVERGVRFGSEPVERASRDPLVAVSSQRRVRHLVVQDRFGIDPRRAGHEAEQDPAEAQIVIGARPVTARRVRTIRRWEQRLDRPPGNIDHFPLEGAHDVRVPPPGRWLLVQHPGSNLCAGRGSAGQGTAVLRAMGRNLGNNMVGISDLGQMGSRITRLLSRLATLGSRAARRRAARLTRSSRATASSREGGSQELLELRVMPADGNRGSPFRIPAPPAAASEARSARRGRDSRA